MPDAEGHPSQAEMGLQAILTALSDPLRYKVIHTLVTLPDGAERTCLSFGFPVSKSTLSHHFKIMREAGLVRQVNRGNSNKAHLRRQDLEERFPGLVELIGQNPAGADKVVQRVSDDGAEAPSRSGSDRPARATGR